MWLRVWKVFCLVLWSSFHFVISAFSIVALSLANFNKHTDRQNLWLVVKKLEMNFLFLQAGDMDKARKTGQLALEAIPMTSEHERLKIWVAFLTLEHKFGTQVFIHYSFDFSWES